MVGVLYPAVNGDGSKVVFESDSTNADLSQSVSGNEIFLWTIDPTGGGTVRALTDGNGNSYNPSIDNLGNRVVFDTYSSDLLDNGDYDNGTYL